MTQRTETRFKVFSRSDATAFGVFQLNNIDFNVGELTTHLPTNILLKMLEHT